MKYELTLSDGRKVTLSPGSGTSIADAIDASGLDVSSYAAVTDDYTSEPSVADKLSTVASAFAEFRQEPIDGFDADDLTLSIATAKLSRMALDTDTTTWAKADGTVAVLTKLELAALVDTYLDRVEALKAETLVIQQALAGGDPVPEPYASKYGVT